MKKAILLLTIMLSFASCNDASMERLPLDSQTEATAFKTYANFQTYTWSLYNVFTDDKNFGRAIHNNSAYCINDELAGYLSKRGTVSAQNKFASQLASIPQTGGGWDFTNIRKVNIMLDNIDKSTMNQDEKDHWRGVGLFFHSYNYIEQIMRFGDVVWLDKPVLDADALIDLERIPREEAADKVLANLKWAEENINKVFGNDKDGKNSVDVDAVRALICRFGLYEGTWRKYHNSGGDANVYFTECERTSKILMEQYPTVGTDSDLKYNSEDLSTYPGSIFYKEYVQPNLRHWNSGIERSGSHVYQTHKFIVEMFLSQNGLPVHNANNTEYDGDNTMYDEFRGRDFRLLLNVVPPYEVIGAGRYGADAWEYTDNPAHREYVDYLRENTRSNGKQLPIMNGAEPSQGTITNVAPHFRAQDGQGFCTSSSGYYTWKSYNLEDQHPGSTQSFDRPIFAIEEVLLNYAEAMYELGKFNQTVADATINKFRPRAKTAPLDLSLVDANFDPRRDPNVDPILWEIRRERVVELFCEGFGFYDIRRWKAAPWFINQKQVGTYVRRTDLGGLKPTVLIENNASEGYVYLFPDPAETGLGWKDTYYLYPIPYQELTLNSKLVQNPGWELE